MSNVTMELALLNIDVRELIRAASRADSIRPRTPGYTETTYELLPPLPAGRQLSGHVEYRR
jgi:hypothetical protein